MEDSLVDLTVDQLIPLINIITPNIHNIFAFCRYNINL
jgi:hydroxymethylpyrimidine/phosphomethylpyrimidine kinase